MIAKFIRLIRENRRNQKEILRYSKEIYWRGLLMDSIKGLEWFNSFPLSFGGWAGGYPLFYILNRILSEYKINNILELGLGESSKFISEHLKNSSNNISHTIIEHNENWKRKFDKSYQLSQNSNIKICELKKQQYKGISLDVYSDFDDLLKIKYDLYLIDGPIGSDRFSRIDMITIGQTLKKDDQFIFIIDDYDRIGEKESSQELVKLLENKNIEFSTNLYSGLKDIYVIGTSKYINVLTI